LPVTGSPVPPKLPDRPNPKLPEIPLNTPLTGVKQTFFGTPIVLNRLVSSIPALSGISEKEVAAYWDALSKLPYADWISKVVQLKSALKLNDWGMYLLISNVFKANFPGSGSNEEVIFTVFTLNQLGYRAKIGRAQLELVPLIAFSGNVFNTSFFTYGNERNVRYSVINTGHKKLPSVQTYSTDYAGATRLMDMSMENNPALAVSDETKILKDMTRSYELNYNRNLIDLYATYPCVDFSVYATAALDEIFLQSVKKQLQPITSSLSQEDAVNALLHFVQFAFSYKTDDEQFGYERWFFAEETLTSSFSDCEDRSILFTQLVRHLLGMKVVLLHYSDRHLATAVKFDNPATTGDYLMVDGQKYSFCDPTYIGASLGMSMPVLRTIPVEVIRLK